MAQQPRAAQGNHEGRQQPKREIETSLKKEGGQRQPRAAQKGNHEERQVWETRRQRHHDHFAISEISNPVIEK